MADTLWLEESPLAAAAPQTGIVFQAGVYLSEVTGLSIWQVLARRGQEDVAATALKAATGTVTPRAPRVERGADCMVIWSGPGQWLIVAQSVGMGGAALAEQLGGYASIIDQSHGKLVLRLAGRHARCALAKVSSLDYDERAFPEGTTALTGMAHVSVQIWREADTDGAPSYAIATFPTFGESLWHALGEACAGSCRRCGTDDRQ